MIDQAGFLGMVMNRASMAPPWSLPGATGTTDPHLHGHDPTAGPARVSGSYVTAAIIPSWERANVPETSEPPTRGVSIGMPRVTSGTRGWRSR